MVKGSSVVTWEEAARGFVLHKRATRAENTALWYETYIKALTTWAASRKIPLDQFTKRHLDEYLVYRSELGKAPTTLHHDALVATCFTEWCKKNDILRRDPLYEYKVRNAPEPFRYFPTEEEMKTLVNAIAAFYDVTQNPNMRECSPAKRSFHRDRNFAIELTKVDTACRIGEIFGFKVEDFQEVSPGRWQLTVTHSKSRKVRPLPLSKLCAEAIHDWLKIRKRVMSNVPKEEDEGWLFISEAGTQINKGNYLRGLKKIGKWAGLSYVNNHMSRRYCLNNWTKDENGGIEFAQEMAGHSDPKTTKKYTKHDNEYMRRTHDRVSLVAGLVTSTRTIKRKRLL